ncbi:PTS transporter subunit IIC, partial [Staphylococcus aureus]|uniref:PTS transporter subunit IIC n=1 Tax=Staphylococcus aureus TaxID=1280 RepID=UPI0037D9BA34
MRFGGGVFIILTGVGLMLGEMVGGFKGICEKVVRNCKGGLDWGIVLGYGENGVLIGLFVRFIR